PRIPRLRRQIEPASPGSGPLVPPTRSRASTLACQVSLYESIIAAAWPVFSGRRASTRVGCIWYSWLWAEDEGPDASLPVQGLCPGLLGDQVEIADFVVGIGAKPHSSLGVTEKFAHGKLRLWKGIFDYISCFRIEPPDNIHAM